MASYKCGSCSRYTETGCEYELTSYYKFRDCMTDKRDCSEAKQDTNISEKSGENCEGAVKAL